MNPTSSEIVNKNLFQIFIEDTYQAALEQHLISDLARIVTKYTVSSEEVPGGIYEWRIKQANELPAYCTMLAKFLISQPSWQVLSEKDGFSWGPCKVLPLRFNAMEIFQLCQPDWEKKPNDFSLHLRHFHSGEKIKSAKYQFENGIALKKYSEMSTAVLPDLTAFYTQVLENITTGWHPASQQEIADYRDDISSADELCPQHDLFIKEHDPITTKNVSELICSLAREFSLDHLIWSALHVEIDEMGRKFKGKKLYLWVSKAQFNKVVNLFGFKFT